MEEKSSYILSRAPSSVLETQNSHFHYFLTLLVLCLTSAILYRFRLLPLSFFSTNCRKPNTDKTNRLAVENEQLPLNLPPSPPSLPLLGHLHHLFSSSALYKSFHHLATQYGPLVYLRLGTSTLLLVSSPSMASEIFKAHDVSFASRPKFAYADKILYGPLSFINAPYGDYWRFLKKLCVMELLGPHQVNRSRAIRTQELHSFLQRVIDHVERSEVIDLGAELVKLTNNVICRMTMSTSQAGEVRELLKQSFELAGKLYVGQMLGPFKSLILWLYGRRVTDLNRKFDHLLEKILKEHERDKSDDSNEDINRKSSGGEFISHGGTDDEIKRDGKDMMDILLEVHENEDASVRITRGNIKAFFTDLIIAGTDSSSQTMQWVIAELINHPDVLKKAREEIEDVVGKTRLVEESDIPRLPYLQAVVKETLRLHPTGPVTTRVCCQSCKIQGYDIPETTPVAVNLYTIMRDPDSWEDPDEFKPERFLSVGNAEDSKSVGFGCKGQSLNFIPFGAGRRGCPGTLLALTLVNSVIAAAIQCFDWKIDSTKVDMQPGSGMSLAMARPLKCLPVVLYNPFIIHSN